MTPGFSPVRQMVLVSGGVESVFLLHQLRPRETLAVHFDYAQRGAARELQAAAFYCGRLGVPLERLPLVDFGTALRDRQEHKLHVPVAQRNLFIVGAAVSAASQWRIPEVVLALNADDLDAYPSAGCDFLQALQALLVTLDMRLSLPLLSWSKADIVRQGSAEGIDWRRSYSCLLGHERHCGHCDQCRSRRRAFALAEVSEPADFYRD